MSTIKHRHLGRDSAHRQALLRNLVTALIDRESITTTWAKAKEAQRMAEKVISLGKRNTEAARNRAQGIFYEPQKHMPKLFGELRERYADRAGGYTRLLLSEPIKDDQAPSAILSLVDGPKDMRFAMTAKALVRQRQEGLPMHELTSVNIRKVTRFRKDGEAELEAEVHRLERAARRQKDREQSAYRESGETFEYVPKYNRSGPGEMERRRRKKPGEWEEGVWGPDADKKRLQL